MDWVCVYVGGLEAATTSKADGIALAKKELSPATAHVPRELYLEDIVLFSGFNVGHYDAL